MIMEEYHCNAITVYCSSSNRVDKIHLDVAGQMGRLIAECGYTLVFGGGKVGLMGALSAGARERAGKVKGVILRKFLEIGVGDPQVTEMIIKEDMRSRKQGLEETGDAFIALPGGFGTLEEITEVLSFKQLGFHKKAIIFLNVNGYFNSLIDQFEVGFAERFIESRFKRLYKVVETPEEALAYLKQYQPPELDLKYRELLGK